MNRHIISRQIPPTLEHSELRELLTSGGSSGEASEAVPHLTIVQKEEVYTLVIVISNRF